MDEQNLTGGSGEVKNMQGDQKNKFSSLKKIVSEQKTFVWLGAVVVILAVVAGIGGHKSYAKTATYKIFFGLAKAPKFTAGKVIRSKILPLKG